MARVTQPETFTAGHHAAIEHTSAMIEDPFRGIPATGHAAIEHTSAMIKNDEIVDADINASAAIASSKLDRFARRLELWHRRPCADYTTTSSTTYVAYGDAMKLTVPFAGSNKYIKDHFVRSAKCDVRLYETGYGETRKEWLHTGGTQSESGEYLITGNLTAVVMQFKSDDGSEVSLAGGYLFIY